MWRLRQKEKELDDKLKGKFRVDRSDISRGRERELCESQSKRHDSNPSCSSSKRPYEDDSKEDEGLRDEEIEEFLHSRFYN